MPTQANYIATASLKDALRINDTVDDLEIGFALAAASRAIDDYCHRQFNQDGSAVTRYFMGETYHYYFRNYLFDQSRAVDYVEIPDYMGPGSAMTVQTASRQNGSMVNTLVEGTDYFLYPYNAAADNQPYTRIITNTPATFPHWPRSIQISAKWGWSYVPSQVEQACLIQAMRFFMRRNAPFGIAESAMSGSPTRLLSYIDADVAVLLRPLVRYYP